MSNLNVTERAWIIGKLHSNIAEYFAHWEDADFRRDQLDEVYRTYLTERLGTDSRQAFVAVLKRWIGQLHNAHSWCHDKQFKSGSSLGFSLERMEEGWVVVSSLVDEVVPGDVIEAIDGLSPQEWMDKVASFLTTKHSKARESQWQHLLSSVWDTHETQLRVRTRNDRIQDVVYTPMRSDTNAPGSKQEIEGRWLTDGAVGYISIPSFNQPHVEETALRYVRQFADAQAIIVDVRSNGGGSTPGSLIDALMDRPYRWWTETSPNIGYLWRRHRGQGNFTIFQDGSGASCQSDWNSPIAPSTAGVSLSLRGGIPNQQPKISS